MRDAMLAILALLATGTAATAAPSLGTDYPWCVMGGELGAAGDCSYWTLAQCQASASGRWNLYCSENKNVLFARQQALQEQQQGVQQPRRRRHRDY